LTTKTLYDTPAELIMFFTIKPNNFANYTSSTPRGRSEGWDDDLASRREAELKAQRERDEAEEKQRLAEIEAMRQRLKDQLGQS
jgi:hypothetical protein